MFYQTLGCLPNLLTSTCIGWKIMGLHGFDFKGLLTLIIIKYKKKNKNENYFFINLVPISVTDALWEITD